METIHTIEKRNTEKKTAVAVGYFDGMHIGHRELMRQMLECAEKRNLLPTILTFDMRSLRATGKGKHDLFPREHTLRLAEQMGVQLYAELSFEDIRNMEPDQFASRVLSGQFLNADVVFCGTDFRYGKDRAGSVENLLEEGRKNNFEVCPVESVTLDGEVVSTTRIKDYIRRGEIGKANGMLGAPYSLSGEVIHGNHLAHGLGFPTANLLFPKDILAPPKGVYLAEVLVGDKKYRGITNIGTRPTITEDVDSTAETHILDFDEDIYGKRITLLFYDFIRPEQRFQSKEELVKVVQSNIEQARNTDFSRFAI